MICESQSRKESEPRDLWVWPQIPNLVAQTNTQITAKCAHRNHHRAYEIVNEWINAAVATSRHSPNGSDNFAIINSYAIPKLLRIVKIFCVLCQHSSTHKEKIWIHFMRSLEQHLNCDEMCVPRRKCYYLKWTPNYHAYIVELLLSWAIILDDIFLGVLMAVTDRHQILEWYLFYSFQCLIL